VVPKVDIETFHNFYDFSNPLVLSDLQNENSFEFGDIESSGCSRVVAADSPKMGPF